MLYIKFSFHLGLRDFINGLFSYIKKENRTSKRAKRYVYYNDNREHVKCVIKKKKEKKKNGSRVR